MEFAALLYIFTGNDERSLHLIHGFTAMAFFDTSVIGSDDEDSFFQYAGIFNGLDDAGYIGIQFFQLCIIFGSVMSRLVSYVVGIIETDGEQSRPFFFDMPLCTGLRDVCCSRELVRNGSKQGYPQDI